MYHSTDLNRLIRHCELSFATPVTNREPFHVGTAAHAIMEEATNLQPPGEDELKALADQVCQILISRGRSFDGQPEPPLPPEPVFEGRDIAIDYMHFNGIPEGEAEVGLAVTQDGEKTEYLGPEAYYGALIDNIHIGIDGDEDMEYDVCVVTDYKSAWPTNEAELDTLQRKGQAVLAWKHYGDRVQCIRTRVVNLRTGGEWSRDYFLDEVGVEQLHRFWGDVKLVCRIAEEIEEPEPRAGANCVGCHHAPVCSYAWLAVSTAGHYAVDRYATAHAVLSEMKPVVRDICGDRPVNDQGVGLLAKEKRKLTDNAIEELVAQWGQDNIAGILTAAKIGVGQAENIAKAVFPGRENAKDRKAFIASITEKYTVAEFGVWNK